MYKKQGLLTLGGGAGIWGAEEDFLQLSGVSGSCSGGGECSAAGILEGQREHLSAVGIWGAHGGLVEYLLKLRLLMCVRCCTRCYPAA